MNIYNAQIKQTKNISKHRTDHFQKKNIFCEGANQSTESIDDNDEANKNEESHR